MRHFLSTVLGLHWTVVFALLAGVTALDPHDGLAAAIRFMGGGQSATPPVEVAPEGFAAAMAVGLGFVATLFLWTAMTAAFGRKMMSGELDQVACLSFGSAAFALSLLLVVGAFSGTADLLGTVAIHLAALLVSFLTMLASAEGEHAERRAANCNIRDMARQAARMTRFVPGSRSGGTPAGGTR